MASPFQFSVRQLLVTIAFVAIGVASLLNANPWWVGGMWFGALSLLSASILLTIHCCREQRAFWLGFALFGWISVVTGTELLPVLNLASHLPQSAIIRLYNLLPESRRNETIDDPSWPADDGVLAAPLPAVPPADGAAAGPETMPLAPSGPAPAPPQIENSRYIPIDAFLNVGEAIWRVLFAYLGGCISLAIYRTRPIPQSTD